MDHLASPANGNDKRGTVSFPAPSPTMKRARANSSGNHSFESGSKIAKFEFTNAVAGQQHWLLVQQGRQQQQQRIKEQEQNQLFSQGQREMSIQHQSQQQALPPNLSSIVHGVMEKNGINDTRQRQIVETVVRQVYEQQNGVIKVGSRMPGRKASSESVTSVASVASANQESSETWPNGIYSLLASPRLAGAPGLNIEGAVLSLDETNKDVLAREPVSNIGASLFTQNNNSRILSAYRSDSSQGSQTSTTSDTSVLLPCNVQTSQTKVKVLARKNSSSGARRKQIFANAKRLLERSGSDIDNAPLKPSPRSKVSRWSKVQDEALIAATKEFKERNWKGIAELVPGRDHVQCLQRWKKVLRPGLIKGPWTPEEDAKLVAIVQQPNFNMQWSTVAEKIPGRTLKQCRERWGLNLDPNINRNEWSAAEDALLLSLCTQMGHKWCEIKHQFQGRTENAVKTRFKSLMRAKAREWTPEHDKILIEGVASYGRDWAKLASCLPVERSTNSIKARVRELAKLELIARRPKGKNIAKKLTSHSSSSSSG